MKILLLIILLSISFGCSCSSNQNLTRTTPISESIEIEASTSSMASECMRQNAKAGTGQNQRNCDPLIYLYANRAIWNICEPILDEKKREYCFEFFQKRR